MALHKYGQICFYLWTQPDESATHLFLRGGVHKKEVTLAYLVLKVYLLSFREMTFDESDLSL